MKCAMFYPLGLEGISCNSAVLGLPQAPDNSFFPPSVLVFQKLINVGPAFIPDYRVNLLYILDSNLPAKKLLLGNQYSTFIEHITKNIHT